MSNIAVLNNVDHKELRIITSRSADYGDDVNCAITFPAEFRNLQANYPIVFGQEPQTGQFVPLALFGFTHGQNLFLKDGGWDANYIPLVVEREPFLIGVPQSSDDVGDSRGPVIHVDMDSPRISSGEGERVFLEHGGISDYLDRVNSVLKTINDGLTVGEAFASALQEHGLLEPFSLDVELNDGSQNRMAGYHTINEQKLAGMSGDELASLHQHGYLMAIYMVIASMSNLRALIDRQNALLEQ